MTNSMTDAPATSDHAVGVGRIVRSPLGEDERSRPWATIAGPAGQLRLRLGSWVGSLVLLDATVAAVASLTGLRVRFGDASPSVDGVSYVTLAAVLPPLWVLAMAAAGSYGRRCLVAGADQYRCVLNGSAWLVAGVAFASFAFRADLSRAWVLIVVPLTTALTILGRYAGRKALHRVISRGRSVHRAVVVGTAAEARDLIAHVHRVPHLGFRVVAALSTRGESGHGPDGVEWLEPDMERLIDEVHRLGADTIVVAGADGLERGGLRKLSWELEGTDIDLVVAPSLTDLAGPRIRIRPVDGLPLLHIERPEFTGVRRLFKAAIDRLGAAMLLVLAAPVMAVIGLAVRLTSRGPVLFRQTRVGVGGREFELFKFRTMCLDADRERVHLFPDNEHDGVLFKIRRDPRVTPLGRWLRRFSLDELPQLWNVFTGAMSLVGPRPPLPSEVERYDAGNGVHRRLLVKPGMTGLWQVSGRADLPWEEAVRLDLYYVENWSVALDLLVLVKTATSVLRGRGAY